MCPFHGSLASANASLFTGAVAMASMSPCSASTTARTTVSYAARPASAETLPREKGIAITGPWPADTVFGRATRGEFDAVIACYHDQGLIPVKLLAFGQAVNVTLGLPIIRTSVDHGTAFDIAGKGIADHSSLVEAILLAAKLVKRKRETDREL